MFPESAYALWRAGAVRSSFLQETADGLPGERFLQLVWQHQRVRPDQLITIDGRRVQVLHPGFWNRGRGPDFQGAVLRMDDGSTLSGDVEIDLQAADWAGHGHSVNPDFSKVILQVVWFPPSHTRPDRPVLPLLDRLDASIEELIAWIDLDPGLPDNVIGRCASGLRRLPTAVISEWLSQAAIFRFQRKGMEFSALARQVGWEQALWEGLCGALGYQHNVWPMRCLAQRSRALILKRPHLDLCQLQALLFGMCGLLPHEAASSRPSRHSYVRTLWNYWWRERDDLAEFSLPPNLWKLGGARPANHPQRRVALTAHWLLQPDFFRKLESWLTRPCPDSKLGSSLLELLQAGADPYFEKHWTLVSEPVSRPLGPLLGETRATDLATNVVLPWFWTRANAGHNLELQQQTLQRFLRWPAAQDNSVLRLARQRLLAGGDGRFKWRCVLQQGLLQVIRDFCGHSNALCDQCVLPDRLKQLSQSGLAEDAAACPVAQENSASGSAVVHRNTDGDEEKQEGRA